MNKKMNKENTLNKPKFKSYAEFENWKNDNIEFFKLKVRENKINNTDILSKLKKAGFTIRISHKRAYSIYSNLDSSAVIDYLTQEQARIVSRFTDALLLSRGGYTEIKATRAGKTYTVVSTCHDDDNYCYALGVKYALQRLNSDLQKMEGISIL